MLYINQNHEVQLSSLVTAIDGKQPGPPGPQGPKGKQTQLMHFQSLSFEQYFKKFRFIRVQFNSSSGYCRFRPRQHHHHHLEKHYQYRRCDMKYLKNWCDLKDLKVLKNLKDWCDLKFWLLFEGLM